MEGKGIVESSFHVLIERKGVQVYYVAGKPDL